MSITCVAAMQQAQERIQLLTMPQKQNSQDKPKHKFVADAREIALSALLLMSDFWERKREYCRLSEIDDKWQYSYVDMENVTIEFLLFYSTGRHRWRCGIRHIPGCGSGHYIVRPSCGR